jgi:hypothetical protein
MKPSQQILVSLLVAGVFGAPTNEMESRDGDGGISDTFAEGEELSAYLLRPRDDGSSFSRDYAAVDSIQDDVSVFEEAKQVSNLKDGLTLPSGVVRKQID